MNIKYNLKSVVDKIAEKSDGIVNKMKKFEGTAEEYFISEVTEEMLLELGFEYKGYTHYGIAPYYLKGNILAYFDDVVLHVMDETFSALDIEGN